MVLAAPSLLHAAGVAEHSRAHRIGGRKGLFSAPEEFFGGVFVCFLSLLVTSGPPDSSLRVWQVSAEDSGKETCF